jgi:hypothetical protein
MGIIDRIGSYSEVFESDGREFAFEGKGGCDCQFNPWSAC